LQFALPRLYGGILVHGWLLVERELDFRVMTSKPLGLVEVPLRSITAGSARLPLRLPWLDEVSGQWRFRRIA
jgi:hypothetical protein